MQILNKDFNKEMVTRESIRNLLPGQKLTIECSGTADLDSTYQTAWQVRKELGLSKDVMPISRLGSQNIVIVEHRKDAADGKAI
ncbi:MAG: hypothetical protein K2K45_06950 [Muribaculaceae bacterium]|nr:hypothetical protein [Muribaculaceae bacterium]